MKLAQILRVLDPVARSKAGKSNAIIDLNLNDIINYDNDFDLVDGDIVVFKRILF